MSIIAFVTCPNIKEARNIAARLVKERLAACVNILSGVESLFWWQGKVDSAQEVLLVIKTRKPLFKKLEKLVKSLHSYSVPEIISIDISAGSREYLGWIKESTK